jgi:hypothetical protein
VAVTGVDPVAVVLPPEVTVGVAVPPVPMVIVEQLVRYRGISLVSPPPPPAAGVPPPPPPTNNAVAHPTFVGLVNVPLLVNA